MTTDAGLPTHAHTCAHTLAVEHDVLRLQVSVDDALLVQVAQSHGDLSQVETESTANTTAAMTNELNIRRPLRNCENLNQGLKKKR